MSGEVLFEIVVMGEAMRVAAVDEASGVEVSVTGPRHARAELEALALKKLARALAGESGQPAPPRAGKLI